MTKQPDAPKAVRLHHTTVGDPPASSANKRTRTDVWGRLLKVRSSLVIVVVALCASVLAPVAVSAHDSTTETYEVEVPVYESVTEPIMATREVPVYDWVPTEVEVPRTREVPVYDWVPTEVEVQRTRQVPVYDWVPTEVEVERTREVPVYDWVPTEVEVQRTRQVPVYDWVATEFEVERTREVPVYAWVATEVEVQRTRVVPVYNEATYTVRVAPFRERVTFQPPCEWTTVYGQRVYYCPPPRTRWQDVYNYQTATRYVLVGTRTETYMSTEIQLVWTQTGTRTETYTATEIRNVRTQTGTRTETYTSTETQLVRTQTGTRTETYTATEIRNVRTQTGTRTQTYTSTETQLVWTQTGTRTETYTATEIRNVRTQTGTRTHTYDTGATRLVKRDTGRTVTETRTRVVHGCPDGYYELDSPDTQAWIEIYTGSVTFSRPLVGLTYNPVRWSGPLDDAHPDCYLPGGAPFHDALTVLTVAGIEYAVSAGEVVIDGVTYVVEAGRIVVETLGDLRTALRAAVVAEIRNALEELDESVVAAICTNLLVSGVVGAAATALVTSVVTKALVAAGIVLSAGSAPALIAGVVGIALVVAGCRLAEPWYTPDPPTSPTGLRLVPGNRSLEVSWDGSPSKDTFQFGYSLRWKRSSQSWDDATTAALDDSTTSYRITGLSNSTAYDVQIEAHNLGGTSSEVAATATPRPTSTTSTTTTTTTTTTTVPAADTVPTVSALPQYDRLSYRLLLRGTQEAITAQGCTPWVYWETYRFYAGLCPR